MCERVIIISREAGQGLFTVAVEPPIPGEQWQAAYADYRSARGCAGGIRMVKGFPIRDQSGEAHG